ncbi:hypothetical protein DK924_10620 [Pseudoalteromonas sp. meg-B1]|nr:hypothetical protein DK924_10620 [Pseudoalteromonas sp. meg-B1]
MEFLPFFFTGQSYSRVRGCCTMKNKLIAMIGV